MSMLYSKVKSEYKMNMLEVCTKGAQSGQVSLVHLTESDLPVFLMQKNPPKNMHVVPMVLFSSIFLKKKHFVEKYYL